MQLQSIDKQRYRNHLNKVIIGCIILLTSLSLSISTLAIAIFSSGSGNNFWLNFSGVALAVLIIWQLLKHFQHHPFLTEVKYVLDLKHQLNLITRSLKKIQTAADNNHPDALLILLFSYEGAKQVYCLDDNIITLPELTIKHDTLKTKIDSLGLSLDTANYTADLITQFK